MTTKKQCRANVAAKAEQRRADDLAIGMAALERSRNRQEQALWDAKRSANRRKAAMGAEDIPDNFQQAYNVTQGIQ